MIAAEKFQSFDPDVDLDVIGLRWSDYKLDFENYMVSKCLNKFKEIDSEVLASVENVGQKVRNVIRAENFAFDKYDNC